MWREVQLLRAGLDDLGFLWVLGLASPIAEPVETRPVAQCPYTCPLAHLRPPGPGQQGGAAEEDLADFGFC
jgi:hypothetical protein